MKIEVSSLLLLLGLVNAQQQVYHQGITPQQFGLRIQHENSQHDHENSQIDGQSDYVYSYDISDHITGDRKSQEESRLGDNVRGRYSLLDADGSTRTVEYSVNPHSGFNAVVRRDGDQISVPNQNSRHLPLHYNGYQNRRPLASEIFRNRYQNERINRVDTRTRLAQDARTGNVVDLHSGFGVAPHLRNLLPTSVPNTQNVNHEYADNHGQDQIRNNGYETHEVERSEDVQEILARSQYQTHPTIQHHQVYQHLSTHPAGHHHSTAPIHFPGSHVVHGSRANLAYERYSIRPATHEDVRRPTPIFSDSDIRQETSSNDNTNAQNIQDSSTANYPHYPIQQEEIRGPTTLVSVYPTFGPQVAYHETNHSRTAYHGQPEFFGARIDQNNRPSVHQIETGPVSVHEDPVITNTLVTPAPFVTNVYPEALVTPVPEQLYHEISRIPASDRNDIHLTVNNAQNYLYPASTLPLDDNAPGHFFTGDNLAANGVTSLLNIHDFDVRSSLYDHLATPVHFAEPIPHDAHLLK